MRELTFAGTRLWTCFSRHTHTHRFSMVIQHPLDTYQLFPLGNIHGNFKSPSVTPVHRSIGSWTAAPRWLAWSQTAASPAKPTPSWRRCSRHRNDAGSAVVFCRFFFFCVLVFYSGACRLEEWVEMIERKLESDNTLAIIEQDGLNSVDSV